MKVGVLGSGLVGRVLGAGFLKYGHGVMLGTRNPAKPEVQQWLRENPGGSAGTFDQAAQFGGLIVLATLGRAVEEAIALAGPANFSGKTVMDTTNPSPIRLPSKASWRSPPGATNPRREDPGPPPPGLRRHRRSTASAAAAWWTLATSKGRRPCSFAAITPRQSAGLRNRSTVRLGTVRLRRHHRFARD